MHVEVSTNVHVMIPRQQYGWRDKKGASSIFCSVFNIFQFKGRKITGVIQKIMFYF